MRIYLTPGNKAVALNIVSIQSEMFLDSGMEFKILNIQPRRLEKQSENIVGYILDVQIV